MRQRAGHARRLACALSLAALAILLTASLASAHEHRAVADGKYQLIVGFLNEPSIAGDLNGLDLTVEIPPADTGTEATPASGEDDDEGAPGTPVEGASDTLKAEVKFGSETKALTLEPVFDEPGHYKGVFIPTKDGSYSFHIFGTINGDQIDETFTSGPDTFDDVEARADVSFPADTTTTGASDTAVQDAQDSADTAKTLGIIGIVVGMLGLAAGVAGLMMARNARTGAPASLAPSAGSQDY